MAMIMLMMLRVAWKQTSSIPLYLHSKGAETLCSKVWLTFPVGVFAKGGLRGGKGELPEWLAVTLPSLLVGPEGGHIAALGHDQLAHN